MSASESSVPICDTRGGSGAKGVGTEGTDNRKEPKINPGNRMIPTVSGGSDPGGGYEI